MKHLITILTALLIACAVQAAPNITITNWYANYVSVLAPTNTGDTGLGVGTNYVCFNIADLTLLTTNQADSAEGDVRQLMYAIAEYWYQQTQAVASSNRPAYGTVSESASYTANTNATIFMEYTIKTWLDLSTGSSVIPDE